MVAVLQLTAEELELVLEGQLSEPRYRAFPAGRRGTYDRGEEIAAEMEGRDPRPFPEDPRQIIERRLTAHFWNRRTFAVTIFISETRRDGASKRIVAVGRAVGGPRLQRYPGARRVLFGPWAVLDRPLSLDSVVNLMTPPNTRTTFRRILDEPSRPLPPATETALLRAMAHIQPGITQIISAVPKPAFAGRRSRERLEQRDANATVLSFLTPRWRSLTPIGGYPTPVLAGVFDNAFVGRSENDFVEDDSSVFPGWERGQRPQRGWWTFKHRDRVMWIKNINVSTAESASGADLLYVHNCPRAIVLVQYKLLERTADGEPILRPDVRFRSQVRRLVSLKGELNPDADRASFRLAEDFVFMKFVDPQWTGGLDEDELTPGRYYPARYISQWVASGPKGPRGGTRLSLHDERSISRSVFASLVGDLWIGSRGDVRPFLAEIGKNPSSQLTLAVSEDVEAGDRQSPHPYDLGIDEDDGQG